MVYDFKFSVLMPVYNVEKYVGEAIDSIINQSIGFKENVELIIIDDGSPDNSKEIALEYQKRFPDNIKVLSKSNGGQATAFNLGLKHANGKYLSFVDSDDYISLNAFEEVYDFFEEHFDEVDLVSIPILSFGKVTRPSYLNFKFDSTRVIDLIKEPRNPQFHIGASFVKNEAFKSLEFTTDLILGYDALMVNKILLSKKKHGVVSSCVYNYRKRFDNSSIMDHSNEKDEFFNQSIKNLDWALIEYSKEKEGHVPKFIQYVVAIDLKRYYGFPNFPQHFNKEEMDEFWQTYSDILSFIDDDVLNDTLVNGTNRYRTYFSMYLKNRKDFLIVADEEESKVFIKTGDYTLNRLHEHGIYLDKIDIEDGSLKLSGTFLSVCDFKALSIEAIRTLPDGTEQVYKDINHSSDNNMIHRILGIDWSFKRYFNFEIPIDGEEDSKINLYIVYNENEKRVVMENKIKFKSSSLWVSEINYFVRDSYIISFKDNSLLISPYSHEKDIERRKELLSRIQKILEDNEELKKENRSLLSEKKSLDERVKFLDEKNRSLLKDNKSLNEKNAKIQDNLKKSRNKNKEILNSISWRITKPLRVSKQLIKRRK